MIEVLFLSTYYFLFRLIMSFFKGLFKKIMLEDVTKKCLRGSLGIKITSYLFFAHNF